eukprot:8752997-Pyramimonas_sp.AAC.1
MQTVNDAAENVNYCTHKSFYPKCKVQVGRRFETEEVLVCVVRCGKRSLHRVLLLTLCATNDNCERSRGIRASWSPKGRPLP